MLPSGSDTNPPLQQAFDFIRYTDRNIFLTGKAGTGKTTFLHNLRRLSPKRMIVVAPTGVAAINAAGVTIHSFFQLGFGPRIPNSMRKHTGEFPDDKNAATQAINRFSQEKINIIRSLDLLVIDEISMVRADLLDGIDEVLRRFRTHSKPFGGVQLLMIGDLHQLAPVAKEDEWNILKDYYESVFFFSSKALKETSYVSIELKHIFRQSDSHFIEMLNNVRENKLDEETLRALNSRFDPDFQPGEEEGYITLTTHNAQAQSINDKRLKEVPGETHTFTAQITGDFPEYAYPTDRTLLLKIQAQVMFVKNDPSPEKLFFNGKIGRIVDMDDESLYVQCEDEISPIEVHPLEWQNIKYSINEETKEIKEVIAGTFVQIPLKLAWAITIHKSQGLTFEKAIIDAQSAFAFGQVYVALSRCRSLEGLVLTSRIQPRSIIQSSTVDAFSNNLTERILPDNLLQIARREYEEKLLSEIFDFSGIDKRIQLCLRSRDEHASALNGNIFTLLDSLPAPFREEILQVAGKFHLQWHQLLHSDFTVEENSTLQERISKASDYFLEKMEGTLIQPLRELTFETDNKAVRKTIADQLERLERELQLKKLALQSCKDGFHVASFLEARAKALLGEPERIIQQKKASSTSTGFGKHPLLYIRLREWREQKAQAENLAPRKLMPQRVLELLANTLPSTGSELIAIKGLTKKKVKEIGREILEIILSYRQEMNMEVTTDLETDKILNPVRKKPSREETYELFVAGKSIAEIATLRGMAQSTIVGHLAEFVRTGTLDPGLIVDRSKLKEMVTYFLNHDNLLLAPARDFLGENYEYEELTVAVHYVQFLRSRSSLPSGDQFQN